MHVDGMSQDTTHVTLDLELDGYATAYEYGAALRCYVSATRKPRRRKCWHFIAARLWNARREAVASGVLHRFTMQHDLISKCHADAQARLDACREAEADGRLDARF